MASEISVPNTERVDDVMRLQSHFRKQGLKILRRPLVIAEMYFVFTLILYAFGPVPRIRTNELFLYTCLVLYQIAFSLGYLLEIRRRNVSTGLEKENIGAKSSRQSIKSIRLVKLAIWWALIMTAVSTMTYTGISTISPTVIWQKTVNGIAHPLLAYTQSFEGRGHGGGIYWIIVLASPITWSAFPLSILFFRRLNTVYKVLIGVLFCSEALRWVIMGRNKGVFDLGIIIMTITIVAILTRQYESVRNHSTSRKKYRIAKAIIVVLVLLLLTYFTNTIGGRTKGTYYYTAYQDAPLMKICPKTLQPTLLYLTSYLAQGYCAFSRLIEVKWTPMFGVGNSMFLMSNVGGLLNVDLFQYTYQTKLIVKGIDSRASWHSFYTWVANDVHWIGVVLVMFLLGKLFGNVVKKCVVEKRLLAYPLLCLVVIMIFYLPANNQVFSQSNTFVTFWVLLFFNTIVIIKSRPNK